MPRGERLAWIAAAAALLGAALGWTVAPARFPHAWLAAVVAWSGWPLGSMALLLAHALTGGRWGDALRPALRLGVLMLPVLLLLLLPLAPVLPHLYPWLQPALDLPNRFYLNPGFFAARGAIYLVSWLGIAALVLLGTRLRQVAPPALLLLGVTTTFAAIDATMSLEPRFVSSIYGMLAAAGSGLLALAVAVLLTVRQELLPAETRSDLGKLLLALAMLWTYLDFMQLLIVWQSDLASQAPWYAKRTQGIWGAVAGVVSLGHSVLPILLLLSDDMRRSRRVLAGVARLLIGTEVLRSWWTVLPAMPQGPGWRGPGLLDACCAVAVGALSVGLVLRLRRRAPQQGPHHA